MNKIQENALRQMIRNIIETELSEDLFSKESDSPYQKLFKKTLSKYGVSSPEELSPKLKQKFFDEIDNSWDAGENETDLDETKSGFSRWFAENKNSGQLQDDYREYKLEMKQMKLPIDSFQKWAREYYESQVNETTNSSAAGEYMTPKAFTKDGQDHTQSPAAKAMKDWKTTKRIDETNSGDTVTISKDGKFLAIDKLKNVKNINDLQKFGLDVLNSPSKTEKIRSGEKVTFLASPTKLHALVRTNSGKVGTVTRDMISEQIDFTDENFSPRQKLAQAIRSVRESLMQVEEIVDKSRVFKEQNNIKSSDMYVRSHKALRKIGEQINRISNKIQGIK